MHTIADVMTREILTCTREHTVPQVARAMEMHDIGAVPVCEGDALLGIVTDRDIVVRAIAHDLMHAPVHFIMSTDVATCHEDEAVDAVLQRMCRDQLRRMPVVRPGGDRLVGIVSLADLVPHVDARSVGFALEGISRPVPLDSPVARPATGTAL